MSLNSLASNRVAREVAAREISVAPGTGDFESTSVSEDAVGTGGRDVQNALSALVEYVPAETITLYLAAIAALPALEKIQGMSAARVYWGFSVLTPVLYALIYMGKRNAAGERRWPGTVHWPWWPMIAATVAFMAWGLTVPEGPYFVDDSGRVVTGLIAIITSTMLGVAGRFFAPVANRRAE